jgi:hypothetical protein
MESYTDSNEFQRNNNVEIWEDDNADYCILFGLIVVFVLHLIVIYLGLYVCACKC